MTLEDLGNLGDFIGGLLVAISLIYLAMQVRQNTKSLRAAAYQDAVQKINEWSTLLVETKSNNSLLYRGCKDHAKLDPEERNQFTHLMMIFVRSYAAAKHLEENRLLTKRITEGYENGLKDMFRRPSMLESLSRYERTIDSETVARIRRLVEAQNE